MTRSKKTDDPLRRACTACGARVGQGCIAIGKAGAPLPLVPRSSRLVHAARLEGAPHA